MLTITPFADRKAYSPTYKEHWTCTHYPYLNAVAGALSVFTDLYSVLLPMGMLRHFEAPKRYEDRLYLHQHQADAFVGRKSLST